MHSKRPALLSQHVEDLRRSGLTDETIAAAGIYSTDDADEVRRILKWNRGGDAMLPAMVFPFRNVLGMESCYSRIKADKPRKDKDGKPIKYESPKGEPNRAFFPPDTRVGCSGVPFIITEGEKKALAAEAAGIPTIGLTGVWGWCMKRPRDENGKGVGDYELIDDLTLIAWKGSLVRIVFDSDAAIKKEIQWAEYRLAEKLTSLGATVEIIRLPDSEDGKKVGLDDYIVANGVDAFRRLIDPNYSPNQSEPAPESSDADPATPKKPAPSAPEKPEKESVATRLVKMVEAAGVELFHTDDLEAYALVPCDGHKETWKVKSSGFRRWLFRQFYEAEGKAANAEAVGAAINTLEGKAHFDGDERLVHVRYAEHGGRIYLDLADSEWRVVEVGADGWNVIGQSPVHFRRSKGALPLPEPVRGGSVNDLRPFVNVRDESNWLLLLGYMFAAMRPRGPYPILALFGEHGTAKSTLGRHVQKTIDPRSGGLRSEPKEVRDLMIAATSSWLVAYDNLSHLPEWLSNALCRLATGGGYGVRQHYSDDEEVVFHAKRPALLTSITEVITAADLLDRIMCLQLEVIPDEDRKPEQVIDSEFAAAYPRIFGAMLDGLSAGLRLLPTVQLSDLPRMADAALWAEACMRGAGFKPGAFLRAYGANTADASIVALEASPLTPILLRPEGFSFRGEAKDLLEMLCDLATEDVRKQREWPKNPRALGHAISGEVTKADRQMAKAVNFGLLYGMGARTLQEYARDNYGVELDFEQSRTYRRKFFETYPKLAAWHKRVGEEMAPETRSLLGRRRLMDEKTPAHFRLSSPVLGSEADGAKQAMALLWERREQCPGAFPVLFVHDEIVVEVDADKADAAAEWLKAAMIDGMKDVLGSVPCAVEAQITQTWG
jgi:hypothetical protein